MVKVDPKCEIPMESKMVPTIKWEDSCRIVSVTSYIQDSWRNLISYKMVSLESLKLLL